MSPISRWTRSHLQASKCGRVSRRRAAPSRMQGASRQTLTGTGRARPRNRCPPRKPLGRTSILPKLPRSSREALVGVLQRQVSVRHGARQRSRPRGQTTRLDPKARSEVETRARRPWRTLCELCRASSGCYLPALISQNAECVGLPEHARPGGFEPSPIWGFLGQRAARRAGVARSGRSGPRHPPWRLLRNALSYSKYLPSRCIL